MQTKFKTDYGKLDSELLEMNQYLVNSKDFIEILRSKISNELRTYNLRNVVFTDERLATAMRCHFKRIHIDVACFYSTESIKSNKGLGEFIEMDEEELKYHHADKLKSFSEKLNKDRTLFVINPPFDGTEHLKIFNECKEFSKHVICVHPSTQLQALPTYKNDDYDKYIEDGLTDQEILSFTNFTNTRAFGDLVIDTWDEGCTGPTKKFRPWDYADRCKDKELYPVIWSAIQKSINGLNGSLKNSVKVFSKNSLNSNWSVVISEITNPSGDMLIRPNNQEPYDKNGMTDGGVSSVWNNYGLGLDKGYKKWTGDGYSCVGFDTKEEALEFIKTWTTPEANVVLNCVNHDQNTKHKLIPNILKGDVVSQLGLSAYRQRMVNEFSTFLNNCKRYEIAINKNADN